MLCWAPIFCVFPFLEKINQYSNYNDRYWIIMLVGSLKLEVRKAVRFLLYGRKIGVANFSKITRRLILWISWFNYAKNSPPNSIRPIRLWIYVQFPVTGSFCHLSMSLCSVDGKCSLMFVCGGEFLSLSICQRATVSYYTVYMYMNWVKTDTPPRIRLPYLFYFC